MANKTFLVNIDLASNEIKNVKLQNLPGDTAPSEEGIIMMNTTDHHVRVHDGTEFKKVMYDTDVPALPSNIVYNGAVTGSTGYLTMFTDNSGYDIGDSNLKAQDLIDHLDSTSVHLSTVERAAITNMSNAPTSANPFASINDLSDLGGGDMLKSVYDTNDNGIVDTSDAFIAHDASTFKHLTQNQKDALDANGNLSTARSVVDIDQLDTGLAGRLPGIGTATVGNVALWTNTSGSAVKNRPSLFSWA